MKRLAVLGDSITKGTYTAPTDPSPNSIASPNFADLVCRALGYEQLFNYGMNGTSVSPASPTFPEHAMCRRIDLMEPADAIIIAAGTNDYAAAVPIGNKTDKCEESFYGSLDILYSKAREKYGKVYIVTPIKRQNDGKNARGHTLCDYRFAIEEKAKEYGFFVIDGYLVPIDPKTEQGRRAHILDGLHPNPEGHRLYAECIISEIRKMEG